MTISSFMGLQTALRGLLADQTAIDTTGHNIANANTPGYSRQTADLVESTPLTIPAFSNVTGGGVQIGTGVDVATINRIRNTFLDVQYRSQNTSYNDASTRAGILDQVQTGLAEPSDHGIGSQLSAFWNAWSDVANAPQSQSARQALVNAATTLTNSFNQFDAQLSTIQSQAATQYAQLTGTTGQVQTDANQIATLNQSISAATAAGQNPNDLLDKRDSLIDDLSSLGKVSVSDPNNNGMLQVNFGDAATPLVSGTTVTWPQTMTAAAGGELGALLSLSGAGGQIASYRSALDTVVNQLTTSVNALHTSTPFFTRQHRGDDLGGGDGGHHPDEHNRERRRQRRRAPDRRPPGRRPRSVIRGVCLFPRLRRPVNAEHRADLLVSPFGDRRPAPERLRSLA